MTSSAVKPTCAGRPLAQLQGLPSTHPCDHGTAWAHNLQSENLEGESHIPEWELTGPWKEKRFYFFRNSKITDLQPAHIQTSRASWSTAFAWRKHRPSSRHWHRTDAEKRACGNSLLQPTNCQLLWKKVKLWLPGIALKIHWQEWGHLPPWPSRLQTSALRLDGWSTSRPPLGQKTHLGYRSCAEHKWPVRFLVTCGVLLQAHIKSQFVRQWTRSSQTAQVLQDGELVSDIHSV